MTISSSVAKESFDRVNTKDLAQRSGRRSNLDMICDVLRVVAEGAEKPTRIMQRANLSWKDSLIYLEVLLRRNLLTREIQSSRATYRLTPRGSYLLDRYLKLKEEASELELAAVGRDQISSALRFSPHWLKDAAPDSSRRVLEASGFEIVGNDAAGRSAVTRSFSPLTHGNHGTKQGFVVQEGVESIERGVFDMSHFVGKNLLLEVDPSISYEPMVRDFASEFTSDGHSVFVFTWKGSPVHEALSSLDGIRFYTMTTTVTYPRPTERPNVVDVPQNDNAELLGVLEKSMDSGDHTHNILYLFDNLTDQIISLGIEEFYAFLKQECEIIKKPNVTSVFIIEPTAHDEKAMNLIRRLFADRATYYWRGLKVTRESHTDFRGKSS